LWGLKLKQFWGLFLEHKIKYQNEYVFRVLSRVLKEARASEELHSKSAPVRTDLLCTSP
jgi:hypothetical protein